MNTILPFEYYDFYEHYVTEIELNVYQTAVVSFFQSQIDIDYNILVGALLKCGDFESGMIISGLRDCLIGNLENELSVSEITNIQ